MKNLFKLTLAMIILVFAGTKLFSQDDMTPPKPLDNKVLEGMVGEWTGESDMMGMKYTENVKAYWILNHQFVVMETNDISKDNPNMNYHGMGIVGVDKDGNAKMWWYDDWGADMMATGTGKFSENSLTVNSTNPMYKDDRTFELKDGGMVCSWTSTMMGKDGKEMKMNGSTTYKKK